MGDRTRSLMPQVDVVLVPSAGHSLPVDKAEDIGPRIRAFLDREATDARRSTNTGEAS